LSTNIYISTHETSPHIRKLSVPSHQVVTPHHEPLTPLFLSFFISISPTGTDPVTGEVKE